MCFIKIINLKLETSNWLDGEKCFCMVVENTPPKKWHFSCKNRYLMHYKLRFWVHNLSTFVFSVQHCFLRWLFWPQSWHWWSSPSSPSSSSSLCGGRSVTLSEWDTLCCYRFNIIILKLYIVLPAEATVWNQVEGHWISQFRWTRVHLRWPHSPALWPGLGDATGQSGAGWEQDTLIYHTYYSHSLFSHQM